MFFLLIIEKLRSVPSCSVPGFSTTTATHYGIVVSLKIWQGLRFKFFTTNFGAHVKISNIFLHITILNEIGDFVRRKG